MGKRLLALLLALLWMGAASASAENRPQGSVYLLEGKTLLVSLYMLDGNEEWSREEMRYTRKAMELAVAYLTAAAGECGKESQLIWDEDDLRYTLEYYGVVRDSMRDDGSFYDLMLALRDKQVPTQEL